MHRMRVHNIRVGGVGRAIEAAERDEHSPPILRGVAGNWLEATEPNSTESPTNQLLRGELPVTFAGEAAHQ